MGLFDFLRPQSYVSAVTDNSAAGATIDLQFAPPPPRSQEYADLANDAADWAVEYALHGNLGAHEACAALADAYANTADLWRWIEDTKDYLQRSA